MNSQNSISTNSNSGIDFRYLLNEWKEMFAAETVVKDIWAGITVSLVALPLNLALAIAAGVEPGVGITTGIIAGVVAALFGGQKYAITGPAAAMAVILVEIAENHGLNAIWLVCLFTGALQLTAASLKLGRFMSFIPKPVMVGFANAIGVLVFFNAIDEFLGLTVKPIAKAGLTEPIRTQFIPEFMLDIIDIWQRCVVHNEMNMYAIAIGSIALALAYFSPKIIKSIPGQLVAIVLATVVCNVLDFKIPLIKDIASIPNLLPAPQLPSLPWNECLTLLPSVITVFMLGSIESLLSATVADGMTGSRHRPNQELMGQGLANLVVPFFGGIPVTGVIARTAINIRAGGKTRLSALVHSISLACLIFFLAKFAESIPLAALAAILMLTGLRLIEWKSMSELWRGSKMESCVAITTTLTAVAIDLTAGVFAGILLACGMFAVKMRSTLSVAVHEDILLAPNLASCSCVKTYAVDGPLFFGSVQQFTENLKITDNTKILILHMKRVKALDLTGIETLIEVQKHIQTQGGKLLLTEVPLHLFDFLERSGAIDKIGKENIFHSHQNAIVELNKDHRNVGAAPCVARDTVSV